jgi:myo-inositol-1(or 4)-monophosphatase
MGGACGLNITNVASGRWDAFFEEGCWTANAGPKIWDFSGGKLIIEEAGGVMLDLTGSPFDLMGRTVFCAANQKLADEIVQMMKDRVL